MLQPGKSRVSTKWTPCHEGQECRRRPATVLLALSTWKGQPVRYVVHIVWRPESESVAISSEVWEAGQRVTMVVEDLPLTDLLVRIASDHHASVYPRLF